VFGVVVHAEAAADEGGHAGGSPQLVGPAVLVGTLQEEAFQFVQVVVGEPRGGAGDGFGVEAMRVSGQAAPAMDGGFMDAQDAGDGGGRFPVVNQVHGSAASAFEFSCSSYGSCHIVLYGCPVAETSFAHTGLSKRARQLCIGLPFLSVR